LPGASLRLAQCLYGAKLVPEQCRHGESTMLVRCKYGAFARGPRKRNKKARAPKDEIIITRDPRLGMSKESSSDMPCRSLERPPRLRAARKPREAATGHTTPVVFDTNHQYLAKDSLLSCFALIISDHPRRFAYADACANTLGCSVLVTRIPDG